MGFIRTIVKQGLNFRNRFDLDQPKAFDLQTKVLRQLVEKARYTRFGKEHNFESLYFSKNLVEDYRNSVGVHSYSSMHDYWQLALNGEKDVTWPGAVKYFALSSGTSEGASKFIPVTQDMVKAIKKASIGQLIAIARSKVPADVMTKDNLILPGSIDLNFNGYAHYGDLSGITAGNQPKWFEIFTKPERVILKTKDWEQKLQQIVNEAHKWDVGMVAAVPAWLQILCERIIEHHKLNNIHEIWPNFEVYIHGGVSFEPFKKAFEPLLGKPLNYFETYLASEGFMAFKSKPDAQGMKLLLKNNIYFEFVPFDNENFNEEGELKPNPKVIDIMNVELGKEYALLISTCSGAWRYMIGDTIKFVSLESFEIIITGRTKHFLSLCGEHLSVDNMNNAVKMVSDELGCVFKEFTVSGIPYEGMFAHKWYLGCDNPSDFSKESIKDLIDQKLKDLNDDYKTERMHALRDVLVEVVPNQIFIDWLKKNGKAGGQSKFPRVMKKAMFEDWENFVKQELGQRA